jgi:hypothetical protein
MKNQLIIDTPPGTVSTAAEAETVADADYDFRPLMWFHRVRTESQKLEFCGSIHPTFFFGPLKAGACSLAR